MKPKLADLAKPDRVVWITEEQTVDSCLSFVRDHHLLVGGSTEPCWPPFSSSLPNSKPATPSSPFRPTWQKYLDTVYDPEWVERYITAEVEAGSNRFARGRERRTQTGAARLSQMASRSDRRKIVAAAPTFYVVPGSAVRHAIDGLAASFRSSSNGVSPTRLRKGPQSGQLFSAIPGQAQLPNYRLAGAYRGPDPKKRDQVDLKFSRQQREQSGSGVGGPDTQRRRDRLSRRMSRGVADQRDTHRSLGGPGSRTTISRTIHRDVAVIGTGVIARTSLEWLLFRGWTFSAVNLFDIDRHGSEQFAIGSPYIRSARDYPRPFGYAVTVLH